MCGITCGEWNWMRVWLRNWMRNWMRVWLPLSVSLWNDLSDPVFDGVGLAGFKSRVNAFLLSLSALSFLSPTLYLFLPSMGWLCGVGVFGLIEYSHSLPALHSWLRLIIIIIIIIISSHNLFSQSLHHFLLLVKTGFISCFATSLSRLTPITNLITCY